MKSLLAFKPLLLVIALSLAGAGVAYQFGQHNAPSEAQVAAQPVAAQPESVEFANSVELEAPTEFSNPYLASAGMELAAGALPPIAGPYCLGGTIQSDYKGTGRRACCANCGGQCKDVGCTQRGYYKSCCPTWIINNNNKNCMHNTVPCVLIPPGG